MKQRSIPVAIILTIITCGIYGLYWFVCITDELNWASGHQGDTSGALSLVLAIVTCGLYSIYWAYKMGEKVEELRVHNGMPAGSSPIVFLILDTIGLGIIDYALIQDNLNKCLPPV